MPEPGVPTAAEIAAIVAIKDPVLRNYRITQCYFELSAAVAGHLPGSANWCTFAAWASKQAGQSIRGEDLDAVTDGVLDDLSNSGALSALIAAVREAGGTAGASDVQRVLRDALGINAVLERTSVAVARGNLKVFEEIAPVFAAWCEERISDSSYDEDKVEKFISRLAPGDPPDGQAHLRSAIRSYQRALFNDNDVERAQAILFATVNVGFHEQTRLQPEITDALDAAVEDADVVVARLEKALLPAPSLFARIRKLARRLFGQKTPMDRAAQDIVEQVRAKLRSVVTEHMMAIDLAGTTLPLGADLTQAFPARLARINHSSLSALLANVDPTPNSLRETAATDWASFPERMHFIADLFRAYQELPGLLGPPLQPDEVAAIRAGRRP
jgi:hypothetical protein